MPTIQPYPLLLSPILKDKVWGGRRLAAFGKPLPPNQQIGESWELADLDSTSASGGGGGAAHSPILNGRLAGKTIRDAVNLWGKQLTGDAKLTNTGGFPLLVKFLDARENLSVQVHPSPAYAKANKDAHLKTECWLILAADPGSVIYKGVKPGVTPELFRKHIETGEVVNDMVSAPAVVGECHNLPSGTCHALGAGVLVAEVQTPSDTTYRVYDWGRTGRELHIDQALACIDFKNPAPAATRIPPGQPRARLVTTEFFTVDGLALPSGAFLPLPEGGGRGVGSPFPSSSARATVLTILAGSADLKAGNDITNLQIGATCLIPASLASSAALMATSSLSAIVACV